MTTLADNYTNLVESFCDLLLVSIHQILYLRELYPSPLFVSARIYNHPVRQARHPKLCQWIQDSVNACREQLLRCTVSRIHLNILSPDRKPLERFVFDVSDFPIVDQSDLITPFEVVEDGVAVEHTAESLEMYSYDLEEQFRAVLTKLSYSSTKLKDLPAGSVFGLTFESREGAPAPQGNPSPWIAAEVQNRPTIPLRSLAGKKDQKLPPKVSRSIPVRGMSMGALAMEVWIEEMNRDA